MTELTLVLTSWYFPHKILRWEDAITMIYLKKADVLVEYDTVVRSPSTEMKVPAVIRVRRNFSSYKRGVRFSRVNVYTRDNFTCQYCGHKPRPSELSYDHVVSRARGGRTEWTNIVTACKPCNNKKAARSCDESGMWPMNDPIKPKSLPLTQALLYAHNVPEEWHEFIRASV